MRRGRVQDRAEDGIPFAGLRPGLKVPGYGFGPGEPDNALGVRRWLRVLSASTPASLLRSRCGGPPDTATRSRRNTPGWTRCSEEPDSGDGAVREHRANSGRGIGRGRNRRLARGDLLESRTAARGLGGAGHRVQSIHRRPVRRYGSDWGSGGADPRTAWQGRGAPLRGAALQRRSRQRVSRCQRPRHRPRPPTPPPRQRRPSGKPGARGCGGAGPRVQRRRRRLGRRYRSDWGFGGADPRDRFLPLTRSPESTTAHLCGRAGQCHLRGRGPAFFAQQGARNPAVQKPGSRPEIDSTQGCGVMAMIVICRFFGP